MLETMTLAGQSITTVNSTPVIHKSSIYLDSAFFYKHVVGCDDMLRPWFLISVLQKYKKILL
jgi:hypothetical protein